MSNLVACLIESFLFLTFMNIFFHLKIQKIFSFLLTFILGFILYQIIQISLFIDSQYFLLSLASYTIISLCLYHKEKKMLAVTCGYFSFVYLLQIVAFQILYQFFTQQDVLYIKAFSLIMMSVIIFISQKESLFMKEKLNAFNSNLLTRSVLLALLSVAFLYSAVIVLLESTASYQFLLIFMELIGMIFLLFSISKEYKRTQDHVLDLKQQEQMIQMKNENQEIKAQNDIDIMHIKHEMKNQILTLEYLLKEQRYQEASEFITGLHSDALYKKNIDTHNEVINAICNNKVYHHPDIQFDFQFQFKELNIDNHDLISLIGNALDNAIEYLSHQDNNKNISFSIQQTDDFYIFVIKNSIQDSIDIDNLKTTKQDKENHGFGLTIIKNIVEKYQGTFEVSVENNQFIVSLLISIA